MSTLAHNVALVSESSSVTLSQLTTVAAALQKQATRDFSPLWEVNATVTAFDTLESVPVDYWPVILRDDIQQPGAAGFHTDDHGQPFSLVQVDETWPLTTSHETLEMLADPFGNRTVAGSPPPQAPAHIAEFDRVVYLVEVCDPCEDNQFSYTVNGVTVSDFITPHYYDPNGATGVQYSFRGNISSPHTVVEGGYVSFGNPVTNEWFQIIVRNGKVQLNDLGKLNTRGKSLRETVDLAVRIARKEQQYRIAGLTTTSRPKAAITSIKDSSTARAKTLHKYIKELAS